MARKKIDPNRIVFELDASLVRMLLGKRGNSDRHLRKMLRELARREKAPKDLSVRIGAEKLLAEVGQHSPAEVVSGLSKLVTDGLMFSSVNLAIGRQDKALDVAIMKAFALAKLDSSDLRDWYILMSRFCWAHFGEKGSPGAETKWTEERYRVLLQEVYRAKLALGTSQDAPALRDLEKKKHISYSRLKTSLREARHPEYNRALARPMYEALTAEFERDPKNFEKKEAAFRKAFCRSEADRIGASES
jgi:hypothetical protein